jgi:branched-chain amino acid transport system permease protein
MARVAGRAWRRGGLAATAAVSLAVPAFLDQAALTVFVLGELAVIVTVGISLLMGYAGQVSLGQAAFYAVGAYTAGLMAVNGLPPLLGLLAAPVVAAATAGAVGVPLLRLRGHFLAFATLALQMILLSVVGQVGFTGGDIGLSGIPQLSIGPLAIDGQLGYAYLAWIAAALVLVVSRNVIGSRPGRGLRALATSETAAESAGVPTGRYKLTVFGISAAYAGLAGGIYAFFIGYIAPGSFALLLSIQFVVMAVVGGIGRIWGAVLGTAVITVLVQALNSASTIPGVPEYAPRMLSYAVYGLVLVAVLRFLPGGLLPAFEEWLRRWRERTRPRPARMPPRREAAGGAQAHERGDASASP